MIVVDTSALVAMFLSEAKAEIFADLIDEADEAAIPVVSRVELVSVLCGKRIGAEPARVAYFVDSLHLDHVPVSSGDIGTLSTPSCASARAVIPLR